MLTRLREGTPDAADEARAGARSADAPEAIGGASLIIENLGHSFGELRVIERIDLEAEPATVLGIVGPSGCGKTTLLELIAGLRPPDMGGIESAATPTRASASTLCVHAATRPPPPLALRRRQCLACASVAE